MSMKEKNVILGAVLYDFMKNFECYTNLQICRKYKYLYLPLRSTIPSYLLDNDTF